MKDPVVFDLPFDLLGNLARDHVMAAFPEQVARGAAWSFSIITPKDGEPFGRMEMTPPHSSAALGTPLPSTPPPAIGAEMDLPSDISTNARQRTALAGLDALALDCYVRTRRGGEPHWKALPIALDDMDIRARVRRRAA